MKKLLLNCLTNIGVSAVTAIVVCTVYHFYFAKQLPNFATVKVKELLMGEIRRNAKKNLSEDEQDKLAISFNRKLVDTVIEMSKKENAILFAEPAVVTPIPDWTYKLFYQMEKK